MIQVQYVPLSARSTRLNNIINNILSFSSFLNPSSVMKTNMYYLLLSRFYMGMEPEYLEYTAC